MFTLESKSTPVHYIAGSFQPRGSEICRQMTAYTQGRKYKKGGGRREAIRGHHLGEYVPASGLDLEN